MKKNFFFVGAGGIGMAALERYCLSKGINVAGYDLTSTELTKRLEEEGVEMNYCGNIDSIPEKYRDPSTTCVVYTPAVNKDLACLKWFREKEFDVIKRSVFLGQITRDSKALCFAGTHGKTTTSSMCAHILNLTPGVGCNGFLGGILQNYHSNLILSSSSPFSVIEADEFDRSFHTLNPYIAVITSTDPDHLDIYVTKENYLEAFSHFTSLIKENGYLLIHEGLEFRPDPPVGVKTFTYSSNGKKVDFMALNVRNNGKTITFDLQFPDETIVKDLILGLPIEINVDNAVAAIGAIKLSGCYKEESIREGLLTYRGIERRFEKRWEENDGNGRVIIDDYAHHPKEIETSISTVRKMYPNRKLTVAFQPHLYSRTRDFADMFAHSLSLADELILVDLYPAREKPIDGISSKTIYDKVKMKKKMLIDKENFPKTVKNSNFDILLTLGAGNLPNYIQPLIEILEKEG